MEASKVAEETEVVFTENPSSLDAAQIPHTASIVQADQIVCESMETSEHPSGSEGREFQPLFSDDEDSDADRLMDAETSRQISCIQQFLKADKLRITKMLHKED